MNKRVLSMLLVVAMALSLSTVTLAASSEESLVTGTSNTKISFTDVPTSYWAYASIQKVVDSGLFKGTSDTTFTPNGNMTRAMFSVVLARLDGTSVDNTVQTKFSDVEVNEWYTGAVAWAVSNGIVEGYTDGSFGPARTITRQEIAVFLQRYLNSYKKYTLKEAPLVTSFTDTESAGAFAKDAIEYCRVYGLISGYQDGGYHPLSTVTRAEVASMLSRVILVVSDQTSGSSSGGGGGGGGGGDTVTPTTNYYFLTLHATRSGTTNQLDLPAGVSSNVISDSTAVFDAIQKLYTGENETAIKNYISTVLDRLKGSSFTVTKQSRNVIVSIDSSGVISATENRNQLDLTDYLTKAQSKYDAEFSNLSSRLKGYGVDISDGQTRNSLEVLYDCGNPSGFVTTSGKNLVLKSADAYYTLFVYAMNQLNVCRTAIKVQSGKDKATVLATCITTARDDLKEAGFTITGLDSTNTINALANVAVLTNPTMSNLYTGLNGNLNVNITYAATTSADAYNLFHRLAVHFGYDPSSYQTAIENELSSRNLLGIYTGVFSIAKK